MAKVRLYWRGSKAYLDWPEGGERFAGPLGNLKPVRRREYVPRKKQN